MSKKIFLLAILIAFIPTNKILSDNNSYFDKAKIKIKQGYQWVKNNKKKAAAGAIASSALLGFTAYKLSKTNKSNNTNPNLPNLFNNNFNTQALVNILNKPSQRNTSSDSLSLIQSAQSLALSFYNATRSTALTCPSVQDIQERNSLVSSCINALALPNLPNLPKVNLNIGDKLRSILLNLNKITVANRNLAKNNTALTLVPYKPIRQVPVAPQNLQDLTLSKPTGPTRALIKPIDISGVSRKELKSTASEASLISKNTNTATISDPIYKSVNSKAAGNKTALNKKLNIRNPETSLILQKIEQTDKICTKEKETEEKEDKDFVMIDRTDIDEIAKKITLDDLRKKWQVMPKDQWVRETDLKSRFGLHVYNSEYNTCGIRSYDSYVPSKHSVTYKPLVIIVIHGTWASDVEDYFDPTQNFYSNILEFARKQAEKINIPVEVLSFRWPSDNNSNARQNSSVVLASILNNCLSDYETITIAHSHGCNVVNNASSRLPDNMVIDHIINIAAPVRDISDEQFKPLRFARLTQFYSTSDWVQAAGSLTQFNLFSKGSARKFETESEKKIVNIRTQINGEDPGHSDIKILVSKLDEILSKMSNYSYNKDFDLNVSTSENNDQDAVLIAIRQKLGANSDAMLSKPNDPFISNTLDLEREFSDQQKRAFQHIYGRPIDNKKNMVARVYNGIICEARPVINTVKGYFGFN